MKLASTFSKLNLGDNALEESLYLCNISKEWGCVINMIPICQSKTLPSIYAFSLHTYYGHMVKVNRSKVVLCLAFCLMEPKHYFLCMMLIN